MSPEAVDRILAAVGPQYLPPTLDRSALANDLEWAADFHAGALAAKHSPKRRERLRDILKMAKQLERLLADDDAYRAISSTAVECPRLSLRSIAESAESALKPSPPMSVEVSKKLMLAMSLDKRNEFDWLAGEHLPRLFQRHFETNPGLGRRENGTADSPFIRFAEAALYELGIKFKDKPYSRESIAKAVTNVRTGQRRRKAALHSKVGNTGRKD